jgi:hypothetical protein
VAQLAKRSGWYAQGLGFESEYPQHTYVSSLICRGRFEQGLLIFHIEWLNTRRQPAVICAAKIRILMPTEDKTYFPGEDV